MYQAIINLCSLVPTSNTSHDHTLEQTVGEDHHNPTSGWKSCVVPTLSNTSLNLLLISDLQNLYANISLLLKMSKYMQP